MRLILLSAILLGSATAKLNTRIIGGQPATAGQFPYSAAIHVQTEDSKFFCGGTLYGNEWIVTSGHCVYKAVLFTIQLGSNHLDSNDTNRVTVATSTYFVHPDFNPETIENDIGLIKLRLPVEFNDYVKSVVLDNWDMPDNTYVYVLGWGQTTDADAELSNDLIWVGLTTISNNECKIFYGQQINDNMVCVSGNYNEGTCTGDTGSGLISTLGKHYVLVGVSSFISGNGCESTDPSGYTRTNPYYTWIQNVTTQN